MTTERKPLSIAIVRQRYNPFGGAERFVERALKALAEQPVSLALITRRWKGQQRHDLRVLICDPFYAGRLWRDASFARAVRAATAAGNFDLVQSHERIAGCDIFRAGDGVHATWLEQRARTLNVAGRLMQRMSPWHHYTLRSEAALFRDSQLRAVICNSDMVKRDIAQRFPLAASKVHVVHNGVDVERFHPGLRQAHRTQLREQLGAGRDQAVVIYVGSGFARKGVPQLIEAFRDAALASAQLWIVGKDKDQTRLQRRAERLGLRGQVRFFGPQHDVAPFLGAADVFALPTLYDPMPNAALEALAAGLPVLTSTMSGAAELITTPLRGEVCDALDINAITQGLVRLLKETGQTSQRERMNEAARAAVVQFSTEAMAQELIQLYEYLLTRAPQQHAV